MIWPDVMSPLFQVHRSWDFLPRPLATRCPKKVWGMVDPPSPTQPLGTVDPKPPLSCGVKSLYAVYRPFLFFWLDITTIFLPFLLDCIGHPHQLFHRGDFLRALPAQDDDQRRGCQRDFARGGGRRAARYSSI